MFTMQVTEIGILKPEDSGTLCYMKAHTQGEVLGVQTNPLGGLEIFCIHSKQMYNNVIIKLMHGQLVSKHAPVIMPTVKWCSSCVLQCFSFISSL